MKRLISIVGIATLISIVTSCSTAQDRNSGSAIIPSEKGKIIKVGGVVVDSVGIPVVGAKIRIHTENHRAKSATTDTEGKFEIPVPTSDVKRLIDITKSGYLERHVFMEASEGMRLTLVRDYQPLSHKVCSLEKTHLHAVVLELLGSSLWSGIDISNDFFTYQECLRSSLRSFANHPLVSVEAVRLLTEIAQPEDITWLISNLQFDGSVKSRANMSFVAGAGIHPDSTDQWEFLGRCLKLEYGPAAFGAALRSSTINGSSKAKELLEKSLVYFSNRQKEAKYAGEISNALERLNVENYYSSDSNLETLIRETCQQIASANFYTLSTIFSRDRTRVLIHVKFRTGHTPMYSISLLKLEKRWVVMGIQLKSLS